MTATSMVRTIAVDDVKQRKIATSTEHVRMGVTAEVSAPDVS